MLERTDGRLVAGPERLMWSPQSVSVKILPFVKRYSHWYVNRYVQVICCIGKKNVRFYSDLDPRLSIISTQVFIF